ncbi:ATP-dependent DNA helicase [Xylona heveae TC161]|uniref:ATP-dependent DNA helicase II subunit 1 n=1 Tax=Xylona heveae (strain CBS 132557 / TC161) TaxID=1328760 RepID=A0A165H3R7_XYLHT|nr:ATP-dependent DNA helicase [Xylona heveae TC161]KZF22944.1 ATP-dependent DNA helicase [Xylona heveae TC161]
MLKASSDSESKPGEDDSPAAAALKCAFSLMQQRIISNPSDMMGILLFGTEQSKFQTPDERSKGGLAYPHCYLLADLDVPSAEDVKRLKSLVEDEEESKSLLVPSKEPVSMANVLFCANQIFTTKAPNFSSRRLFIVTDNDDPHTHDKALKSAAAVRAKDLYDLGVIIELFPISKPDHDFDRSKFYDDIVYRSSPLDPEAPAPLAPTVKPSLAKDGISLLHSLLSSINSKAVARRALFANLPLELGPGFKISVKGYIIFKRQVPARSCYVWLQGEKAQIAKGVTTQMADDTSRTIEKAEIKKAYKFGGDQVAFTPEEIKKVRNFGDPVIRIIGFKPLSSVPFWASVKQSTFIYPSEEDFVGSTRVFAALQQKLLRDEKVAIVWFIARKNAAPVISALVPGPEQLGDIGEQVMPPGMWLVPLPYADDVRSNPDTTLIQAPDSLVDMMRTVIQQLQLPKARYDPQKYPNPALQWHYRILQVLALDEDLPEKPEDKTIPKYRQIDKRAGGYVIDWGHELEDQFRAWQKENGPRTSSAKRSAPDESAPPKKRTKPSDGVESGDGPNSINDNDIKQHYSKNSLNKLTVPILKSWMENKGLSTSGKKSDLVERVEEYFENK